MFINKFSKFKCSIELPVSFGVGELPYGDWMRKAAATEIRRVDEPRRICEGGVCRRVDKTQGPPLGDRPIPNLIPVAGG